MTPKAPTPLISPLRPRRFMVAQLGGESMHRVCLILLFLLCWAPQSAAAQLPSASDSEYQRNLSACLYGSAHSCRTEKVAPADLQRVADSKLSRTAPATATYGCAENGSCYGDITGATGRPKTVSVGGYYRKDGTYVRGHYRSKPRRR